MALRGQKEQALALLSQAVLHAMPEIDGAIDNEPDLTSLHGDPRFAKLVCEANDISVAEDELAELAKRRTLPVLQSPPPVQGARLPHAGRSVPEPDNKEEVIAIM
jgi:hypothetical protein